MTGYGKLTVRNLTTGASQQSQLSGCPPATQCTPALTVSLNDSLRCSGILYKCDESVWQHIDLGPIFVEIQTGACGGSGTAMGVASTYTTGGPNGEASFSVDLTASSSIMSWLNQQTSGGGHASFYARILFPDVAGYSSEVQLTPGAAPPAQATATFHMDNTRGTILVQGATKTDSQTGTYQTGIDIVIEANPTTGYAFASWASTGGISVANSAHQATTMVLSANGTITANFVPSAITYTPTISVSPTTIQAGTQFIVSGSGFNPAVPISIYTTDQYGNNLQSPASQSPAANGSIYRGITLDANITYSGVGYVIAKQSGSNDSNSVQIFITPSLQVQHRYFTRYVRIDAGTLPAYVTFYVQDLDDNAYLSQETLTLSTLGKRTCFKGSGDRYDTHHIRVSVKNSGSSMISVTFGLAYQAQAAMSGNQAGLTPGSETSRVDVGTWSLFSASDFDYSGCEQAPEPPPSADCDSKFPNRSINLWEGIGWGFCVASNAVSAVWLAAIQPIIDRIVQMLDPFLTPFLNFISAFTAFGTSISTFLHDPRAALKTWSDDFINTILPAWESRIASAEATWATFFKPVTDKLGEMKLELPDIHMSIADGLKSSAPKTFENLEQWATDPAGRLLTIAGEIGAGLADTSARIFKAAGALQDTFNESRFRTDAVKALTAPIWDVLGLDSFSLQDLALAFARGPWGSLYDALEPMLVGPEPATYETARERAEILVSLELDLAVLVFAIDSLFSLLPRGIRILDRIPQGVRSIIAAVMVTKSVGELFGPALKHSLTVPLERQWRSQTLDERPGPGELASMRSEGHITKDEYTQRMRENGYPPAIAELLYKSYLQEPTYGDITTLWHRGKITQTAFANLLEVAKRNREYEHLNSEDGSTENGDVDAWIELTYRDPTWRQLSVMATSGKLSEDQIDDLIRASGTRPEFRDSLKEVLMELPGATQRRQVLTLEARLVALGRLDEATYNADAVDLKISDTIAGLILRAERTRLKTGAEAPIRQESIGNLNTWYLNDIIDADTYRQNAQALAYDPDFIDKQLAYLDKRKTPIAPAITEREATRAMFDAYYTADLVSVDEYRAALADLRYDTEVIELQIELLDKRKAPPVVVPPETLPETRDLLQGEAIAAYKAHAITEAKLRERLSLLGRTEDAIDVLVATAQAQMASSERSVTQALLSKAYKVGTIDRATYTARLLDMDFSPENAELIISTDEAANAIPAEALTLTETLNAWEEGYIDLESVQKRLTALGKSPADQNLLLSFSVRDMLKAKHITAAEADKLWESFGLGPEERQKLAIWYGGATA